MDAPGAGTVVQIHRAGVIRVGWVDLPMGARVRVGSATGVIAAVRTEDLLIQLQSGSVGIGDRLQVIGEAPPPLPVIRPFAPLERRLWWPTGSASIDLIEPMSDRIGSLWICPTPTSRTDMLTTSLSLPRPGKQVVVLPAATPHLVERWQRHASRMGTQLLVARNTDPPRAHLDVLDQALARAIELRDAGNPVVLAVDGLGLAARSARDLARVMGQARDPFGWPMALGQQLARLTDHTPIGSSPLTVIAAAVLDEPGLFDALTPWFDHRVELERPARRGLLPTVQLQRVPVTKLGSRWLPRGLRRRAGLLKLIVGARAAERSLVAITQDLELQERVQLMAEHLSVLSQPVGTALDASQLEQMVPEDLPLALNWL